MQKVSEPITIGLQIGGNAAAEATVYLLGRFSLLEERMHILDNTIRVIADKWAPTPDLSSCSICVHGQVSTIMQTVEVDISIYRMGVESELLKRHHETHAIDELKGVAESVAVDAYYLPGAALWMWRYTDALLKVSNGDASSLDELLYLMSIYGWPAGGRVSPDKSNTNSNKMEKESMADGLQAVPEAKGGGLEQLIKHLPYLGYEVEENSDDNGWWKAQHPNRLVTYVRSDAGGVRLFSSFFLGIEDIGQREEILARVEDLNSRSQLSRCFLDVEPLQADGTRFCFVRCQGVVAAGLPTVVLGARLQFWIDEVERLRAMDVFSRGRSVNKR